MTLLIISPDYASHLYPLAALGTNWLEAEERVVVASGKATAAIVESFGFEHVHLQLSRGSNPGVIRAEEQPEGEDVAPETIIVDHLAFSARLGMVAAGIEHIDVVLGHPTALPLPAASEVYGLPPAWPAAFSPEDQEIEELRNLCTRVSESFTSEWNLALAQLAPERTPSPDAFAEHGDVLVFNYPGELVGEERAGHLPPHIFIGSSVRTEAAEAHIEEWISESDEPFVYVSFGSFLSVRGDVLNKVVTALKESNIRAAVAYGSAGADSLGEVPDNWLVGEFLPQVTLLGSAAAAVTHGGNNSVTESLTFGGADRRAALFHGPVRRRRGPGGHRFWCRTGTQHRDGSRAPARPGRHAIASTGHPRRDALAGPIPAGGRWAQPTACCPGQGNCREVDGAGRALRRRHPAGCGRSPAHDPLARGTSRLMGIV